MHKLPMSIAKPPPVSQTVPVQSVVKVRRDYNAWVARESIEDYALRFTPRGFRKWSELRVANTAFGAASFLVLEAVGGTLLVKYGFTNAFWAILVTGLIIFLAGLPISRYAARYGVDMDLLTRGAGFGYIGSTVTSLIYASFTFIFFALEAAIMAYALELAFDIPPAWGYLICALVVIPLVLHGVTTISKLQTITLPVWLGLMLVPYGFVLWKNPGIVGELTEYAGVDGAGGAFNPVLFGAAVTVGIALVTQMGEQVDYLRFMPERTAKNRLRWHLGVLIGGPGWVVLGVLKMLGGALLAYLAISLSVPAERAVDPNQMYLAAYENVFDSLPWAVGATALLVVISQLKINVTNAYAGSLAWSNFFARLTHSHPGRVVWVVFNTLIALVLMELNVFDALSQILGLYANIAISWMMVVVADLVINKPLGWSPPGIEFRRAHLYDINPVGVGAMATASALSVTAYLGAFGPVAQAFSAIIALCAALVTAPLLAWATDGRFYLARQEAPLAAGVHRCVICESAYEAEDMARCPAYQGHICSLCCSLDARCHDACKPEARLSAQWAALVARIAPRRLQPYLDSGLGHYLLLMSVIAPALGFVFVLLYVHQAQSLDALGVDAAQLATSTEVMRQSFAKSYAALLLVSAIFAWWLVLTQKSRRVAQEESNRQTLLLMREIDSHQKTDVALQKARQDAETANRAKSRYITAISHELRTPLNSILGYAQILDGDPSIPESRRQAVSVIRRSGDHLLSVIEGTLDIARIEGGRLTLDVQPLAFGAFVEHIVRMFEVQAGNKGLGFTYTAVGTLPEWVRADEKRLRQILINLLGNAVKFTARGTVSLKIAYAREMATLEIADTGPGIAEHELSRIFEPFHRGSTAQGIGGSGLGLTIARMFVDVMGGELQVQSTPGRGTCFTVRLYLPRLHGAQVAAQTARGRRSAYRGGRKRLLVVDNEAVDREWLAQVLSPLGFSITVANSGEAALAIHDQERPDAIFLDLAMPGLDGWETLRRLRERGTTARIAIVSANAFDRGQENNQAAELGIRDADFIVKPVRIERLLDWLGEALAIEWIEDAVAAPAVPPARNVQAAVPPTAPAGAGPDLPPRAVLLDLMAALDLGHVKAVRRTLGVLQEQAPGASAFVARLQALSRDFEFDTMRQLVAEALDVA
jgi:signal transduction histidine kinase/CheY-like chemotaxis protein/purine-cytosine permease-like protein